MRQLLILCLLAALASCQKPQQQSGNEATPSSEAGPIKGVDRSHKGTPAPDVTFRDAEGEDTSLADFSGQPVLVNLWATWCAPCVKELPTLDLIAGAHRKGEQLNVVAISQDTGPHASVIAFLKAHRIAALEPYQDPNMGLSGALGPDTVLPTTILYDASGKEVWRYVGDLDWTSADAAKLLAEAKPGGKG
jgi:thiol-disulfide isomerase/thioredoxin